MKAGFSVQLLDGQEYCIQTIKKGKKMAGSGFTTKMTKKEVSDAIDGLMAYDLGCVDSGIHDEVLRDRVKRWLNEDDKRALSILREIVLDTLSKKDYTVKDVNGLFKWLSNEMGYYL